MSNAASIVLNNYDAFIGIQMQDLSNVIDHIPAMVYRLVETPKGPILIKDRPRFEVPTKKYGRHSEHFAKLTRAYDPDSRGFGVLMDGMKGGGKSLLAEDLGNWMISGGRPVIIVDYAVDAGMLSMIIKIVGPCMVYFDEFGKMYTESTRRDHMLTLFSDSSLQGTLFVVTSNDRDELSEYMINRPGRFKYMIRFGAMKPETAEEIGREMKVEEWKIPYLRNYTEFHDVTFDQMLTLIRETAGSKSVEEMITDTEILNIPALVFTHWGLGLFKIDGVSIDAQDIDIKCEVEDILEVSVIHEDQVLAEITVDMNDPSVKKVRGNFFVRKGNALLGFQGSRTTAYKGCGVTMPSVRQENEEKEMLNEANIHQPRHFAGFRDEGTDGTHAESSMTRFVEKHANLDVEQIYPTYLPLY